MSVQVAVRSRPLNADEQNCGASIIVRMNGNHVELVDSSQGRGMGFNFDHAFWSTDAVIPGNKNPRANQETVFRALGKSSLEHTFQGYNSCIFAYGQTGSGKTYSMMGMAEDDGIIPRIAGNIFKEATKVQQEGTEVIVEVSYLEIYNERVRCLLNPKATQGTEHDAHPLKVREHPITGPYVEGLAKMVVTDKEQFLQLMNDGNRIRTTGATAMNAQSSRSHAVFTVIVTQKTTVGSVETTKISKMNLVDLAGSERADKTHATGSRLVEGSNINKSLSALGNVISTLAEEFESGKARHIPYRDSSLTWILKDNLGGNSKTLMLATISPASAQYEETVSTLRYAERAKKVQLKARVNESNNNEVVAALQKEIDQLKLQLKSAVDQDSLKRLNDELSVTEAVQADLNKTLEMKMAETRQTMKEHETHMQELEETVNRQKNTIQNLQAINTEKDKKINALLQQIAEKESRSSGSVNDEIDRLRLQIAELEVQRDHDAATEKRRRAQSIAAAKLRTEDMGNVKVNPDDGGKVSVKALAKAFESHTAGPVQKTVQLSQPNKLPQILQRGGAAPAAGPTQSSASLTNDDVQLDDEDDIQLEEEDNILEYLEDDVEVEEPNIEIDDLDEDDIQIDDEAPDAAAAEDDDIQLDDAEPAAKDEEDIQLDDEPAADDIRIDDDESLAATAGDVTPAAADGEDDIQLDDEAEPVTPAKGLQADDITIDEPARNNDGGEAQTATVADTDGSAVTRGEGVAASAPARARGLTVTGQKETHSAILPPATNVSNLVIPSHTLPNNRFLREPFKVIKIDEGALIGGKKERIWDVDFFGKKFANLDMMGYESFSQPSANLFRVEKDPKNAKKLTMYFFDAAHPYDLEFTSTERRQRFYELAMVQRRNSIMWCPSLCPEGVNDIVLNIQGTTINRPTGKVVKAKGDVKFMIARMPYEVIDFYYGCFSLQEKSLPRTAAVIASFLPKAMHEVYIIGITDVPKELMGSEEIGNYLLSYLGPTMYFVLASTAVESKAKATGNNVIVVLVRRSFIVRISHIDAADVTPARKEGVQKHDFSGTGCALRINECSIGVLLVNANPSITDATLRGACLRGLMSNFPFGNTDVDIGARFDYFLCSGAFGFRGDFTDSDMLKKQMKAGNVMSDFVEGEPHSSLLSQPNPMRILALVRPRVCRFDIRQYQTSRAMAMPNSFITADIFCQRAFLSTFGEQVPRCQFVFTKLQVIGHRIPHINSAEIQMHGEWLENSPLLAPLTKQGDTYFAGGKNIPAVMPVVSNFDFLRLQALTFSVFGVLPASREKKKLVIASGVLPLKNSFSLGETVDFSVTLYYRGCQVGFLNGTLLQVHTEKNDVDIAGAGLNAGERDAHVVVCYENQVLDAQGTWVAALHPDNGAWDWSSASDSTVQTRRESFQLPDPEKWKWLTQWRHEARTDNVDGWCYAVDFQHTFEQRKSTAHKARRRRWTRVMQAEDALILHRFLEDNKAK
jgi:hypothetical protein